MSQSGKLVKDVEATTANKLLVICVDRDNDVGSKTGILLLWLEGMHALKQHKDWL